MTERFNFLPHTDQDRQEMLKTIGVRTQDDLFADIPAALRQNVTHRVLPENGLSEQELYLQLKDWASKNQAQDMVCFLGGGAYHRFIPPAVNTIAMRSEFYTAYTPYQPEIAQGTLQYTYEFQSMICELTGMDVANASVYDGGSAVTEAALMAIRATKRNMILIADSVNPEYRSVLKTYLSGLEDLVIAEFSPATFNADPKTTACVIIQQPNYFGHLEATDPIRKFCEESGALFVVSAEPFSLALLKPPGDYGADIVVGDIQPLGNNLAYGGPYGGFMACREKYLRQLPGRLVGKSIDKNNQPCYTLTLQTREQHIKRARATSNICTNQALNVLKATIFMSLAGPVGLKHLMALSAQRAHVLAEKICALPGVSLLYDTPFVNEFVIKLPVPVDSVLTALEKARILGGIPLSKHYPNQGNTLLVCCTEMTSPEAIERYVRTVSSILQSGLQSAPKKQEACC